LVGATVELHQKLHIPLFDSVVERTLCEEIPGLVKSWNMDRLQQECETQAGLLTVASSSGRVWETVNTEVGSRLLGWVTEIVSTYRQTRSLDRAQAEISSWKKTASRTIGAGVVVFGPAARTQVTDIFARCYDDCVSSSSFAHAEEIDRLLLQVGILMGADRRLNPAAIREAGRFEDTSARNLPPLIRVVGCN